MPWQHGDYVTTRDQITFTIDDQLATVEAGTTGQMSINGGGIFLVLFEGCEEAQRILKRDCRKLRLLSKLDWDTNAVADWLKGHSFDQSIIDAFTMNRVTGRDLYTMNTKILKDFALGASRAAQVMRAIEGLVTLPAVIDVSGITWKGNPSYKNGRYYLEPQRWPPGGGARAVWKRRDDPRGDGKFFLLRWYPAEGWWMLDNELTDTDRCSAAGVGDVADPTRIAKWVVTDMKEDGEKFWNKEQNVVVVAV